MAAGAAVSDGLTGAGGSASRWLTLGYRQKGLQGASVACRRDLSIWWVTAL